VETGHSADKLTAMEPENTQRLVAWKPVADLDAKTPSFGDMAVCSPQNERVVVTLLFEGSDLRIEFKDARAFMTSWDGDPNPFLAFEEAKSRPSDLLKVEGSRWLASCFYLDIESSLRSSEAPWEHFCILSGERSRHVAARNDIEVVWTAQA
jgi:hypothetical protein